MLSACHVLELPLLLLLLQLRTYEQMANTTYIRMVSISLNQFFLELKTVALHVYRFKA